MKRFKYLYFSNIISDSPLYRLWLFKKIKGGEKPDNNLLTEPSSPFTHGGLTWEWNGYTATGSGKATSGRCFLNSASTPLKEVIGTAGTYTINIKQPIEVNIIFSMTYNSMGSISKTITAGSTSTSFELDGTQPFNQFRIGIETVRNTEYNLTIEDFKLVKVS